ncbi:uncharacterized protein LOC128953928 [Oppia nitens]|uniref:uncharacterized protein LOC128953928 n=1 Tax=Oppia nitens TaxID=1686743 RepID=UPI0023DC88F1|nr:uncharacterized protein LOC128953928 [Oppia nitens]
MYIKIYKCLAAAAAVITIVLSISAGTVQLSDNHQCNCRRQLDKRANRCLLQPEAVEGPYYLNQRLVRRDIRERRPGVPFELKLKLTNVRTCRPLDNVRVDVWQCDATGNYSGYISYRGPTDVSHVEPVDDYRFLRGSQFTDSDGMVQFDTIFPGWYPGRTVHIHLMAYSGPNRIHTGQLYFSEQLTRNMARLEPYRQSKVERMINEEDLGFTEDNGARSMVKHVKVHRYNHTYPLLTATVMVGLNV